MSTSFNFNNSKNEAKVLERLNFNVQYTCLTFTPYARRTRSPLVPHPSGEVLMM